jgi:Tfp pilus assembly major pilin PilA
MRPDRRLVGTGGFTVTELVIILVILGIIAAVAIPQYRDIAIEAREASCRSSLISLRSGISIWYANKAARGNPCYPPIDSLLKVGSVMEQSIPGNPYQDESGDSIVAGNTRGRVYGTSGGWAYNDSTGEIWANTNAVGESQW